MMNLQDFTLGMYFVFSLLDSFSGYVAETSKVTNQYQLRRKNGQTHFYNQLYWPISTCASGKLILKRRLCNGKVDCDDGSDETLFCRSLTCNDNQFRCEYGACIALNKQCDNIFDCADGSDENQTICKSKSGCLVPFKTDKTIYSIKDCDDCLVGSVAKEYTILEYECVPPYIKSKQLSSVCVKSKWVPDVPTCIRDSMPSTTSTPLGTTATPTTPSITTTTNGTMPTMNKTMTT